MTKLSYKKLFPKYTNILTLIKDVDDFLLKSHKPELVWSGNIYTGLESIGTKNTVLEL